MREDSTKRAELERQFGLPLTRLSEEEWSRVKAAAAKTASEKLHIPFSKAASHYEAFVPEGYAEAITRKPEGAKGAPGKKTTNPTLADESWRSPGVVDLSEASAEDRYFIRRAEAYAFEHCMSWNEATRYITR